MRLNSKEAKEDALQRDMFRMRQLPTILKASNALNKVLEIEPGTRMVGNMAVRVWHMPQKPKSWMQVLKELHAGEKSGRDEEEEEEDQPLGGDASITRIHRMQRAQAQTQAGRTPHRPLTRPMRNLDETDGKPAVPRPSIGLSDSFIVKNESGQPYETAVAAGSAKKEGEGNKQKRKLEDSPCLDSSPFAEPSPQNKVSALEKEDVEWLPQIIVTDCDEPLSSTVSIHPSVARQLPPPPAPKPQLFPPIPESAQPASPPIDHAKMLEQPKQDRLPIYWDWLLSKRVCEWLDDEDSTTSTQTELTHIELRNTDNTIQPLRFEAKDFEKVKLTRLTISPEADTERSKNPAIQGPPEQRDWFIFEVQHKNVIVASMEMDEDGVPVDEPDQDPEDFPEDYWLLAMPVCAVTDSKSTSMDLKGSGMLQTTAWKVGAEGFMPSLHGRGVGERFAEEFVNACAGAKGVVEFASIY
ncbi:hypothetical protein PRZ48_005008 [Zasmidium cellare]|uniref:N-acetyltransferase domain-containing protein n=1 Tax=Zasmidium cellare TaxID=395010 RepID=A0ABR0ESB7_ZASCE|nr:hypothetical protein PRZ48_005008 [Zasmidium cellare]